MSGNQSDNGLSLLLTHFVE